MVSFISLLILGLGDPIAVPRESWSDIQAVHELRSILRQEVDELKRQKFNIYKANIPFDKAGEINVSDIPQFQELRWLDSLAELWPNGFEPSRVHLVIELVQAAKPPASNLRSTSEVARDLASIQAATVQYLNSKESPSQAAKPSNFSSIQTGNYPIWNGRPHTLTGRPIALYDQVFDEFKAAITCPPTIDYLNSASTHILKFIHRSREIYQCEDERLEAPTPYLNDLLGLPLSGGMISFHDGDRIMTASGGGCLLINAWKNEVGTGGCDHSVQAAFSYAKYWGQETMRALRESCCCPSFILVVAGPWMCVLGAIFLEQPVIEPLTDFVWIGPRDRLSDGVESVARIFHALASTVDSLRFFYDRLDEGEAPERFYPWVTYFLDGDGHKIKFRYINALGGEYYQRKAVFKAQTIEPNPRTIIVKFTRRYNSQAHKLLAGCGYAPKLVFDGSKHPWFPRPAGLLMIVTEFIIKGPSHGEVYPALRAALDLLHDRGLVFGDLRSPNILIPKRPANQDVKPMLIDFDWCGKDGEDRYPLDINPEIAWASGVGPGTLMRKHHDDFMLESIAV